MAAGGAVVALGVGCGGQTAAGPEGRAIHSTVQSYLEAVDAGRGTAICHHLSNSLRRRIERLQKVPCKRALAEEARRLPAELNGYVAGEARISGRNATVLLTAKGGGFKDKMGLEKVGARWKITDAPGLGP